jgi:hypothetical protein
MMMVMVMMGVRQRKITCKNMPADDKVTRASKQASKHGDDDSLTCVRGLIWECPCPWSPSPSPFSTSTTIIVIVVVVATASATAGGEEHPTVGDIMQKHTHCMNKQQHAHAHAQ